LASLSSGQGTRIGVEGRILGCSKQVFTLVSHVDNELG